MIAKSELAHGDEPMVITAEFELHHAKTSMRVADNESMNFFLRLVTDKSAASVFVSMWLKPHRYDPTTQPPEFPPSNLYFALDQRSGVAAAALLAFTHDHTSYQWLPRGDAWSPNAPTLIMDDHAGDEFPRESYMTVTQLHNIVHNWAWGRELPPSGISWRAASEDEVAWHWIGS